MGIKDCERLRRRTSCKDQNLLCNAIEKNYRVVWRLMGAAGVCHSQIIHIYYNNGLKFKSEKPSNVVYFHTYILQ